MSRLAPEGIVSVPGRALVGYLVNGTVAASTPVQVLAPSVYASRFGVRMPRPFLIRWTV